MLEWQIKIMWFDTLVRYGDVVISPGESGMECERRVDGNGDTFRPPSLS